MGTVSVPSFRLPGPVVTGESVRADYPQGYSVEDFIGTKASAVGEVYIGGGDRYRERLGQVQFIYDEDGITVRNMSGQTWPTGELVRLAPGTLDAEPDIIGGGGEPDPVFIRMSPSEVRDALTTLVGEQRLPVSVLLPPDGAYLALLSSTAPSEVGETYAVRMAEKGEDTAVLEVYRGSGPAFDPDIVFDIVIQAPVMEAIANRTYVQGSNAGAQTIDVSAITEGTGIEWSVTGPAAITTEGILTLSTQTVRSATSVTVRATNAAGFAERTFTFTVTVAPLVAGAALPAQIYQQNSNSGTQTFPTAAAFVGAVVTYSLVGAPVWATINSATGVVSINTGTLRPVTTLTVRAANAVSTVDATVNVTVASASGSPPTLTGTVIADRLNLVRGATPTVVATAPAFAGASITYSTPIAVPGVSINASTGAVTLAQAVTTAQTTVTVRATNASGYVETSFNFSVAMKVINTADVTLTWRPDPTNTSAPGVDAGFVTWTVDLADSYPGITSLWWRGLPEQGTGISGYHPMIPHPTIARRWIARAVTPGSGAPRIRPFLYVNDPAPGSPNNVVGDSLTHHFVYTTDDIAAKNPLVAPPAGCEFSAPSAALVATVTLEPVTPATPNLSAARILPIYDIAEYNASLSSPVGTDSYFPGDGLQQIVAVGQSMGHPDVVALAQDSGRFWLSSNFGAEWRRPVGFGLFTWIGLGVAVDPVDPDRLLVYGGSGPPHYDGVYLSTDFGATFSRRVDLGLNSSDESETFNGIAYDPTTIGASRAERWFGILGTTTGSATRTLRSLDGGLNWTDSPVPWGTARGDVNSIVGDPGVAGKFWISATTGVWVVTDAFSASPEYTQLTIGGQNTRAVVAPIHVSANGATVQVAIPGVGIYRSLNGGGTWTRRGTTTSFSKAWISPWNPDHMTLVTSSSPRPAWCTDGVTFTHPEDTAIEKRPGPAYTADMVQPSRNHTIFHPTAGRRLFIGKQSGLRGSNTHYRTTDHGRTWKIASRGYSGSNCKMQTRSPGMFSVTDENKMLIPYYDVGAGLTLNGTKSIKTFPAGEGTARGKPDKYDSKTNVTIQGTGALGAANVRGSISLGAAIHPGAGKNILLMACTDYDNLCNLIRSPDNGNTWAAIPSLTAVYSNFRKTGGIFYNYSDFGKVFWHNRRSVDGDWAVWEEMNGLTYDDVVVAQTFNRTGANAFYTSNTGRSDGRLIRRSLDNGASWQTVINTGYSLRGMLTNVAVCAHPFDVNVLFIRDSVNHRIRKYQISGTGTLTATLVATYNMFGGLNAGLPAGYTGVREGASGTTSIPFSIGHIAADPRDPDTYFLVIGGPGRRNIWRTSDNFATFEDLSDSCATGTKGCIEVHPLLGDAFTSGDTGTWVIAPTYKTIFFTAGAGTAIAAGQTITRGGASGTVKRIVIESGSFAGGNAAGYMLVHNITGTFAAGAATASGTGTATLAAPKTTIFDNWPQSETFVGPGLL